MSAGAVAAALALGIAAPAGATPVGSVALVGPVYVGNGVAFTVDLGSNLLFTVDGDGFADSRVLAADPAGPGYAGSDSVNVGVSLEYDYDVVSNGTGGSGVVNERLVGIDVWIDGTAYSSRGPAPTVMQNPDAPGALQFIVHMVGDARFANGALLTIGDGNIDSYLDLAVLDFAFTASNPNSLLIPASLNMEFQAIQAAVPLPLPVLGLLTGLGALVLVRRRAAAA